MYSIFEVEDEKTDVISDILSNDLISRQTTSVRDGKSLDLDEDTTYVMIEGSEEAVEKGRELFEEEDIPESDISEKVYKIIKEKDETAATGMGTIFG